MIPLSFFQSLFSATASAVAPTAELVPASAVAPAAELAPASAALSVTLPMPAPATAFAAGILPYQISSVLMTIVNFYVMLIIAWALLSWFANTRDKGLIADIYRIIDSIVSPYVKLFRRFIPPMGGIDFSPLIAILLLQLVARFLL
ncbi:MAG: YggT family protein [Coriobacteriales bacterium]|jgi:uncharacterized protein YggT (Ycf19 family)|nr:YggT family protein [Coriobacteriales bacterium]